MSKQISSAKKICFLFVALILVGAGCNPFSNSPEENITEMKKNMTEVRSVKYEATASVSKINKKDDTKKKQQGLSNLMGGSSSFDNFDLTLSGQTAVNGYVNPNSKMDITVNPSGSDKKIELNLRQTGNKSYIKLQSLGPLQSSPIAAMFGSMVVGEWLELPENMSDKQKEEQNEDELTKEQVQEIKDLIENRNIMKFVRDLGTEQVNGKEALHYRVRTKPEEIKKMNNKLAEITGDSKEEDESFSQNLEKLKDREQEWDLWIGSDDKMLYKMKVDSLPTLEDNKKESEIDLTITFSDFNSEINVEKPENTKSVKELMGGMFGGGQQGSGNGSGFLPSGSSGQNQGMNFEMKNNGDSNMEENVKKRLMQQKNMETGG